MYGWTVHAVYVFRTKQWLTVTPLIEAIPWHCRLRERRDEIAEELGDGLSRPDNTAILISLPRNSRGTADEIIYRKTKDYYGGLLLAAKKSCNPAICKVKQFFIANAGVIQANMLRCEVKYPFQRKIKGQKGARWREREKKRNVLKICEYRVVIYIRVFIFCRFYFQHIFNVKPIKLLIQYFYKEEFASRTINNRNNILIFVINNNWNGKVRFFLLLAINLRENSFKFAWTFYMRNKMRRNTRGKATFVANYAARSWSRRLFSPAQCTLSDKVNDFLRCKLSTSAFPRQLTRAA